MPPAPTSAGRLPCRSGDGSRSGQPPGSSASRPASRCRGPCSTAPSVARLHGSGRPSRPPGCPFHRASPSRPRPARKPAPASCGSSSAARRFYPPRQSAEFPRNWRPAFAAPRCGRCNARGDSGRRNQTLRRLIDLLDLGMRHGHNRLELATRLHVAAGDCAGHSGRTRTVPVVVRIHRLLRQSQDQFLAQVEAASLLGVALSSGSRQTKCRHPADRQSRPGRRQSQ